MTNRWNLKHIYSKGGYNRSEIDDAITENPVATVHNKTNAVLVAKAPEMHTALAILIDEVERHWPKNERYPEWAMKVAKEAMPKVSDFENTLEETAQKLLDESADDLERGI